MNDITALALLVSKAKASAFTMEYISQFEASDIDSDDVDLRFEVDGFETGTNVSIVDECGQAAQMILALVEALEKAQQRISDLEKAATAPVAWTDEQELRDVERNGCGYLFTVNPITPNADPRRVIKLYTVPPAMESLTVTVKLPDERFRYGESDYDDGYVNGWNAHGIEVKRLLAAAGIQVIEGEA